FDSEDLWKTVRRFHEVDAKTARAEFELGDDGRDWTVVAAKKDVDDSGPARKHITQLLYRPFDLRFTYWTGRTKGFLAYPRREVMRHLVRQQNLGLMFNRQVVGTISHFGVSRWPTCHGTFYLGNRGQDYLAPLYLYPTEPG